MQAVVNRMPLLLVAILAAANPARLSNPESSRVPTRSALFGPTADNSDAAGSFR